MVLLELDSDAIRSLPLSSLPNSTKQILSDLLNSKKVIPTDGPEVLPRDWRGLLAFANISAEVAAGIYNSRDQTARVLELWTRDPGADVGRLYDCLQAIERYDVYDDIRQDLNTHLANGNLWTERHQPTHVTATDEINNDSELLTFDDKPGYIHKYDAYVLYAEEDQQFVNQIITFLTKNGFQICTRDRLMIGHATEFSPISKLIAERCRRIILIYSPDFLNSPANSFYTDLAYAISIETRTDMTIPIMYRDCTLPRNSALYFTLRYHTSKLYNFWEKLDETLRPANIPRIPQHGRSIQSAQSAENIELSNTETIYHTPSQDRSASVEIVRITPSPEGSITSENSQGKKNSNIFKILYKKIRPHARPSCISHKE